MSVKLKVGEAEGHETGQRQLARYLSQHQGPPTEDEKCEGVIADVTRLVKSKSVARLFPRVPMWQLRPWLGQALLRNRQNEKATPTPGERRPHRIVTATRRNPALGRGFSERGFCIAHIWACGRHYFCVSLRSPSRPRAVLIHNESPFRLWSWMDRAANSFGVSPLRLVWGRFWLKSSRHSASNSRACASERNEVSFNSSSRSRPLKLLHERVLDRLARLDVVPGNVRLLLPAQHRHRRELRAIVADHRLRLPASRDHRVQLTRHPRA